MLARGQRLNTREFKIGNYVHQHGAHEIYIPEGVDNDGFDSYHVDPSTVGWASPYLDTNNTAIFTDDIIEAKDSIFDVSFVGIVKLGEYQDFEKNLHFGFYIDWIDKSFIRRSLAEWNRDPYGLLQVIGNIHDNKDLLQKF